MISSDKLGEASYEEDENEVEWSAPSVMFISDFFCML
jgi:hypothetical protein